MKKLIIEKIEELGGNVSFVDLQELPGFSGNQYLGRPEFNYVYWGNVSHAFVQAVHELIRDEVIEFEKTTLMTYAIDGCTLKLPLVKKAIKYKSPRWLPLVLNKGVNFYNAHEGQAS